MSCKQLPFEEYEQDERFSKFDTVSNSWMFRQQVAKLAIVSDHLRPTLPEDTPDEFRLIVERCWHADPARRPSWDWIVQRLTHFLSTDPNITTDPSAVAEPSLDGSNSMARDSEPMIGRARSGRLCRPLAVRAGKLQLERQLIPVCMAAIQGFLWVGCNSGELLIINPTVCLFAAILPCSPASLLTTTSKLQSFELVRVHREHASPIYAIAETANFAIVASCASVLHLYKTSV